MSKRLPARFSPHKKFPASCGSDLSRAAAGGLPSRHLVESNEFMSETQKLTPDVSVVVPVRNEAGNVAPLVLEIASALSGRAFEIIYVNDGSSDSTEVELIELAAGHAWLRQKRV